MLSLDKTFTHDITKHGYFVCILFKASIHMAVELRNYFWRLYFEDKQTQCD